MDAVVGGMPPASLHYLVSPSKGGKTTRLLGAAQAWARDGVVLYAGLESKASTLRTMLAAQEVGIDPGHVLSGAWHGFENYQALWQQMSAAYTAQPDHPIYGNLHFTDDESVDRAACERMCEHAYDLKARVLIIDHVDHIDGSQGRGASAYQISVESNHLLLALAKRLGLCVILASQLNTGNTQDPFRNHRPMGIERVKMGGHKLEVATTMLSWYRPLRAGLSKDDRDRVREGEADVAGILEPNISAFAVMGHRFYGTRIGMRGRLRWERGKILSLTDDQRRAWEAQQHAIPTAPRDFGATR